MKRVGRPALFETFRAEDGLPIRLDLHLARLRRSAEALGYPYDVANAKRLLGGLPGGTQRVVLELAADGSMSIATRPHEPTSPTRVVTVVWARERVRSDDPARRHKSRDRVLYDRALADAHAAGHADQLFLNERDELAEGAISNVFIDVGGELVTPPVAAGALPGVLREVWIREGRVREATVRRADVERAPTLYLASSLRGARAARLVGSA